MIHNAMNSGGESARLAALKDYDILDTPEERDFDLLVDIAAQICGVPYAFISLVDRERVWHKSTYGSAPQESLRQESYCALAIQEETMLVIPDLTQDARTAGMKSTTTGRYAMYSGAVMVTPEGHKIGTLCVLDTKPNKLTEKQLSILLGLSRQVVSLIELRKRNRELDIAMHDLQKIANEDVLTGLATRRALLERLHSEVERSKRFPAHLTVVMLDLDHFKQINDHFGHAMGDAVLRDIGGLIRRSIRKVDLAGRYGGEEFCLMLPGTDLNGGLKFAESLRAAIAEKLIEDSGRQVCVTASLGVATAAAGIAINGEQLIRAADTALYNAKHQGRNQMIASSNFKDP